MAEGVRRYFLGDTGEFCVAGDHPLYGAGGEAKAFAVGLTSLGAAIADKEWLGGVTTRCEIGG